MLTGNIWVDVIWPWMQTAHGLVAMGSVLLVGVIALTVDSYARETIGSTLQLPPLDGPLLKSVDAEAVDLELYGCEHGTPFRYACAECDAELDNIDKAHLQAHLRNNSMHMSWCNTRRPEVFSQVCNCGTAAKDGTGGA